MCTIEPLHSWGLDAARFPVAPFGEHAAEFSCDVSAGRGSRLRPFHA
jgi:hypothetical protein